MSKVGRNALCPCGSGQKYKRCHGKLTAFDSRRSEANRAIANTFARQHAKQKEIERQFGLGHPPVSIEFAGKKFVAVGSELHWSDKWKTFPDFLMSYFKKVMGSEWGKAELAKTPENWSPLFEWYARVCDYQKANITQPGEVNSAPITGAVAGIMWLTYGLYLLRHNAKIQTRLLQRLRSADPVQIFGAVSEVIMASVFIRAGFDLELENEDDRTKSHCEFTATSKITGKPFSVEVKACSPGGRPGQKGRSRTLRQLSRALAKDASHPRFVCIDLNTPHLKGSADEIQKALEEEMARIRKQARKLQINGNPAPPAVVLLFNFPFRFDLEGTSFTRAALLEGFKIDGLQHDAGFSSIREASEFRREHSDLFRLATEFGVMRVPDTLDGDLPSRTFGKHGAPILIGERYSAKDQDGKDIVGELTHAVMREKEKKVTAVLRLLDGTNVLADMPITDEEFALYRDSPETFFGVYEKKNNVDDPVDLYDWLLSIYQGTPREQLLERLSKEKDPDGLKDVSQLELAKILAEGLTNGFLARRRKR